MKRYVGKITFDIKAIGQRVRTLRQAKGMTQIELAETAMLSRDMINKLENSKWIRNVSMHGLAAIARALGTSVAYLMGETMNDRIDADLSRLSKLLKGGGK